MEINNLFRSDSYNPSKHVERQEHALMHLPNEDKILYGKANVDEMKLLQRSLVGKEMFLSQHDLRMLAIGNVEFDK